MAYIDLGLDEHEFPGITGLLAYRPETAKPFRALLNILLHDSHSMPAGERELIAAYVSGLNECVFCCTSHSAFAAAQLDEGAALVELVLADLDAAPISPKLRALLRIAGAVQKSGRDVTEELVEGARAEGATDVEIHDTVLIAAVFSLANRYVDGLGTIPGDAEHYSETTKRIVRSGYSGRPVPSST